MTVMIAVSSVVFATSYTSTVTFYEKNTDPITEKSYGSTTIQSVGGLYGVERAMNTCTGVKAPGTTNYTYAYGIGYKGVDKKSNAIETGTYSRATLGWNQLYSIHIVNVNDGEANFGCSGSLTFCWSHAYTWDGTQVL